MQLKSFQLLVLIFFLVGLQSCSKINYLEKSIKKQGELSQNNFVKFSFKETLNELGHKFEPWDTNTYAVKGDFWVHKQSFQKQDSLTNSRGKSYSSKIVYADDILLFLDYGEDELMPITQNLFFERFINTARYSPLNLIHYFNDNQQFTETKITDSTAIYSLKIGIFPVNIFINKATNLVKKISYLSYDELYGDVTTTFEYTTYVNNNFLTYPTHIKIKKINGNVIDSVEILSVEKTSNKINLLSKPKEYQLTKKNNEIRPQIELIKYNDYIHFINLKHTDDKVMIVEFDDYLLVAEAPINTKNGELIIAEAKKIAPLKPIKYFVFGHHHPHYLGGLRAFVHKEAIILQTEISRNYVKYIAEAKHTLQPDSLEIEPKKLKAQTIKDSLVLGKNNKMKIYFIGEKSSHTKDYLIYYFPKDKLLFQDDLCWIPREGEIKKAGSREVGLYKSIKELKLNVDTIIQSWPVKSHKVKTIIPFSDLEKAVSLIESNNI